MLNRILDNWAKHKNSAIAAAVSFYTLFSLAPLALIAISIAGFFYGEESARIALLERIRGTLGPQSEEVIKYFLSKQTASFPNLLAAFFGFIILLFGASRVFFQLRDAMNTILEVPAKSRNPIMHGLIERFYSILIVVGIGFLVVLVIFVSTFITTIVHYLDRLLPGFPGMLETLNVAGGFLIITLLFVVIFHYLPSSSTRWREVIPGAITTTILFLIGQHLIGFYLSRSMIGSLYGTAGSILLMLFWLYYTIQIIFIGAEITSIIHNGKLREDINKEKLRESSDIITE